MANKDDATLPSDVRAAIRENVGITFDPMSSVKDKNNARKDNIRIFKEYGNVARSVADDAKQGALDSADESIYEQRKQKKEKRQDLVDSAGKGNMLNKKQEKFKKAMSSTGIAMKSKGGSILKKNVEKMAYGGMSGGKKHMYSAGGNVKDNAGLRALKVASPEAYAKIKAS